MNKNSKRHFATLDELEDLLLTKDAREHHRNIRVEEVDWKSRYKLMQEIINGRFRRGVTTFFLAVLVILLFIPVVFPDRYQIVNDLIRLLLAATSGFIVGRIKIS